MSSTRVDAPVERRKSLAKPIAAVVGVAALAAVGTNFYLIPAMDRSDANDKLNQLKAASGPVQGVGASMVKYNGTKVPGTYQEQKALSTGSTANAPTFTFTNGKATSSARNVDIYIDFSSQPCRDVVLLNQGELSRLIEQGKVRLTVHPVPTSSIYNTYAFEALSEGFATQPKDAWPLFTGLLKEGMTTSSKDSSAVAKEVAKVAQDNGVASIDSASIRNGTFASWIVSGSKDAHLGKGYYPPMIYVNGVHIDSKTRNMNDSTEFRKAMEG